VNQKQFGVLIQDNNSAFKGDNQPVERVSWDEAVEYCKLLSAKEGRKYRLPTEAEWEYACRAGTTTPYYFGSTISTAQANYDGNYVFGNGVKGIYRAKTVPVGSFSPNAWGIYDLCGNVSQWCSDWDDDYPKGDAVDPTGPTEGTQRVMRGGAYDSEPGDCRSASRDWYEPDGKRDSRGFRVLLEADSK
jgi:formylglycine-generating enzyme required for sulfatase activity